MEPFDDKTELPVDPAAPKRSSALAVLIVLAVVAVIAAVVVLHLGGAAPTHGR